MEKHGPEKTSRSDQEENKLLEITRVSYGEKMIQESLLNKKTRRFQIL